MKRLVSALLALIFMISCMAVDVSAYSENDIALTGAVSEGEIWTVVGTYALCNSNWEPADPNNQMIWNVEKETYEKLYTGVPAGTHEFMVVKGNSWGGDIFNLQGNVVDGGGNAYVKVEFGGSAVAVGFDGAKAYVSVTPPSKSGDFSYIVLPDNTAEITDYSGSDADVVIPSNIDGYAVTSIGNNSFNGCVSLQNVTIPVGVTRVGVNAFYGCTKLINVTIPDGVTIIDNSAFYSCESLSDISFPASLASIGNNAFFRCISLKNIVVSGGVINVGGYAFEYCSGLENVTLEDGVESIGEYAFYGCSSLKSVTVPVSLANINKYAFGYCDSLSDVYYDGSWADAQSIQLGSNNNYLLNANWLYEDKEVLAYSYDEENLTATVVGCAPFVESVEIPAVKEKGEKTYAVTTIGANAFSECTNLLTATIYTKDISIGENSFPEKTVVYGYHDIADIVKENNNEFKPLCELESVDHSVITIEGCSPTCASEGLTDGSCCEYCAFVFTPQEVIEKLPHKPIIVPAVAPTCKTEGNTMGSICESCGEVYVAVEVIDKLEHNTVCDNNAVEPDCENTGLTDSYSCTSCGEVVVEQTVVEALGHDYVVLQGKPATSVEEGLTDGIGCSKCDYVLIPQEIIPALSKLGDVNGDGEITITDATIIQRHVAKITELTDGALSSADVSKDGQVAVIDATMIQRFVAKIITDF